MSADDPRVVQPQGMGAQHRYNPYTATLPHVAARSNTGRRPVQSFFMAEDLRQQFLLRSASVLARPEADGVLHLAPTARLSTSLPPSSSSSSTSASAVWLSFELA